MASLFFWRKKKPPEPVAGPAAVPTPIEAAVAAAKPQPKPAKPLPVRRMVYALALNDPRAADLAATHDATQTGLLLATTQEVAKVGIEPRYTPQRPSLIPQLMEVINDEDASLRALARIVSQDPQLTGEMLRTANSPLYKISKEPVESVERAAAVLGTRGMRTMISGALMKPLARSGGRTGRFGEVIWEHSLYSASAGEAWAARIQDADPFAAHMLALLHGLGSVTVYRVLSDIYATKGLSRDGSAIASALDTGSPVAAWRIAQNWGLSERTRQALEAQSPGAPVSDASPLAQALHFGLYGGALILLCKRGRLTEEAAAAQLVAGGFEGAHVDRIWDRLVRAYVRP
jgi:HD-like signal output (HDOD) protein